MPLISKRATSSVKARRAAVKANIKELVESGRSHKEAVAMALVTDKKGQTKQIKTAKRLGRIFK